MVVVGTGGANPDTLKDIKLNEEHYDKDTDLFVSIINHQDPFGFVEMYITPNKLVVKYRKCGSTNQTTIHFNSNQEITYTTKYIEEECRISEPLCGTLSPDETLLEIC